MSSTQIFVIEFFLISLGLFSLVYVVKRSNLFLDDFLAKLCLFLLSLVSFVMLLAFFTSFSVQGIFYISELNIHFVLLTNMVGAVIVVLSTRAVLSGKKLFYGCFLVIFLALNTFFTSDNLLVFYIAFESAAVPMFLLIGLYGSGSTRHKAAYKFLIYSLVGSTTMLPALIYLHRSFGTLSIYTLTHFTDISTVEQTFFALAFFLPFAIKMPIVPLHLWLPEAHVEAPTSISVLLAALLLKTGGFAFYAFVCYTFIDGARTIAPFVIVISLFSLIASSFYAVVQTDLKKTIAYSSVSHMSLVLIGLFVFTEVSLKGAYLFMLAHGINSAALFSLVGVLYDRGHVRLIRAYNGVALVMPVFSTIFFIMILGNLGFPFTPSFFSEFFVFLGFTIKYPFASFIGGISILISIVYSVWAFSRINFGSSVNFKKVNDLEKIELSVLVVFMYSFTLLGFNTPSVCGVLIQPQFASSSSCVSLASTTHMKLPSIVEDGSGIGFLVSAFIIVFIVFLCYFSRFLDFTSFGVCMFVSFCATVTLFLTFKLFLPLSLFFLFVAFCTVVCQSYIVEMWSIFFVLEKFLRVRLQLFFLLFYISASLIFFVLYTNFGICLEFFVLFLFLSSFILFVLFEIYKLMINSTPYKARVLRSDLYLESGINLIHIGLITASLIFLFVLQLWLGSVTEPPVSGTDVVVLQNLLTEPSAQFAGTRSPSQTYSSFRAPSRFFDPKKYRFFSHEDDFYFRPYTVNYPSFYDLWRSIVPRSPSISDIPTSSPLLSRSPTSSPLLSRSPSISDIPTSSPLLSRSPTSSPLLSRSPSISDIPTSSPLLSRSPTSSPLLSRSPSISDIPTSSPLLSRSPTSSPLLSRSPSISDIPTSSPLLSRSPTSSPLLSRSPSISDIPTSSPLLSRSPTSSPLLSRSPSISDIPTSSPLLSRSPSISDIPTSSPLLSRSPTSSPLLSRSPTSSPLLSRSPSISDIPTSSPLLSRSPSGLSEDNITKLSSDAHCRFRYFSHRLSCFKKADVPTFQSEVNDLRALIHRLKVSMPVSETILANELLLRGEMKYYTAANKNILLGLPIEGRADFFSEVQGSLNTANSESKHKYLKAVYGDAFRIAMLETQTSKEQEQLYNFSERIESSIFLPQKKG